MKTYSIISLLLIFLCSCGDGKVTVTTDWGFNKPESEKFYHAGMQLVAQNKNEESIIEFKKGLEIEPGNVLLLLETGNSYKALSKFDEAAAYYNKVLETTPVHPMVYPNYANTMLGKKDNANAIKYGKTGLEKCESAEDKALCAFSVSAAYYNIDSCQQAINYFEDLKKLKNGTLTANDSFLQNAINEKCKNVK